MSAIQKAESPPAVPEANGVNGATTWRTAVPANCPACGYPDAFEIYFDYSERAELCYCRNCGFKPKEIKWQQS